ncbi:conserved hypothetical protein [Culex quinquefasciatus]|uniref:E3 ubiquitin-protein ligase E3D n=1 Tax=Culex quinquefasciatus TaxID=7176 RepID=B0WGJ1_CULQU|nr:conserved hypothetical protein [Culex quinquefasciatus]|eukprot:XP_001847825.1 conserved hypothetical protein [Culex quinquefasciatus]
MPIGNIDRVLIELRPRLQSANFFICFSRRFVEIKSTKIDLAPDRITISTENNDEQYEIRLGDFFKLHTQTLSSLLIKNNYICFRINTNENKFHSEVLEINEYNACTDLKLECRLEKGVNYTVTCSNCGNDLHEQPVAFKRILELPSDHMDSNEWYCHRHDTPETHTEGECSSKSSSAASPHPNSFTPAETDLFYGPFYAVLNCQHLQRVHLRADRFLYCKCCLQFLGVAKRNGSVKLWYENLKFLKPDEHEQEHVNPASLFRTDDALLNFQYLVRKTVNDYNFISHLGLPPIFKIIFEMRRPGQDGELFYLLMQIMDANLNVFKIRKGVDAEDSSSASDDPSESKEAATDEDDDDDDVFTPSPKRPIKRNIHVDRHRTMKVMYRYDQFDQQPIFNFWLQDSNVVSVEISEQMFRAAVRYLDDNSDYVPECYRNNLGFSLSYLDIT